MKGNPWRKPHNNRLEAAARSSRRLTGVRLELINRVRDSAISFFLKRVQFYHTCDECRIELVDDSYVVAYPRGELKGQATGNMKTQNVSRDTFEKPLRNWAWGDGASPNRPNNTLDLTARFARQSLYEDIS